MNYNDMSSIEYIAFGSIVYLKNIQKEFLFARGFADTSLYLSNQSTSQCEFLVQPKNGLIRQTHRNEINPQIVFGTEIILRHSFSGYFLSVNKQENLLLQEEENDSCHFQLIPQRTFEHKGDTVIESSIFAIRNTKYRCYIGSDFIQNEPVQRKIQQHHKTSRLIQSYRLFKQFYIKQGTEYERLEDEHNQSLQIQNSEEGPLLKEEICNEIRAVIPRLNSIQSKIQTDKQNNNDSHVVPFQFPFAKNTSENSNKSKKSTTQKHVHSFWKFERVKRYYSDDLGLEHKFLQNNDYIYFISSDKSKGGLMDVDIEKKNAIKFIKVQGQNEYVISAIFIVEIRMKDIYLKHLITGKYFPFTESNTKQKFTLEQLRPSTQNKLPPFHLHFDGNIYPNKFEEDYLNHGIWLNKVNKFEINEILSLQSVQDSVWIEYLIKYLDSNCQRRQKILQQFKLIKYLLYKSIPKSQNKKDCYELLFKMVKMNKIIRKELIEELTIIIKEDEKNYIIDILSEILDNEQNYSEKYVLSHIVEYIVNQFIRDQTYSLTYLRIFRLFCGCYFQPCLRNQIFIFKMFFQIECNNQRMIEKEMTTSIFHNKKIQISRKFKYSIIIKNGEIYLSNNHKNQDALKFCQYSKEEQSYIRQYFYLLSDTLRMNKQSNPTDYCPQFSLSLLISMLFDETLKDLKGPIISLVISSYLQGEYKYKMYVFYESYEKMFYRGSLVALRQNENSIKLIKFIEKEMKQIEQKQKDNQKERQCYLEKLFKSTTFKHLLNLIKLTIENSYWKDLNSLRKIIHILSKLHKSYKYQSLNKNHKTYEDIQEEKNLMNSKIISLDIVILFFDIKINLCISNLLEINDKNLIEERINEFKEEIKNDSSLKKDFNCFQECETKNPLLIKKSLLLSRKFYQIEKIVREKYDEAVEQIQYSKDISAQIKLIKEQSEYLKFSTHESTEVSKKFIVNCIEGIRIQELEPKQIIKYSYLLHSVFRYKQNIGYFQFLAYKLGVFDIIIRDLNRYLNLRKKQKRKQKQFIYWKFLLFYALIRTNHKVIQEISALRKIFIHFLEEEEDQINLIVIDILDEIYKNNRSSIISDQTQISKICKILVQTIKTEKKQYFHNQSTLDLNIKSCKIMNLLNVFLQVEDKKIKNNIQLIVGELFDKEMIIEYIIKIKNIDTLNSFKNINNENIKNITNTHNLFKVLLFNLSLILKQNPSKYGFDLPNFGQMLDLNIAIGKRNWALQFKLINLYRYKNDLKLDEKIHLFDFIRGLLINVCEVYLQKIQKDKRKDKDTDSYSSEAKTILQYSYLLIRHIFVLFEDSSGIQKKPLSINISKDQIKIQKIKKTKFSILQLLFLLKNFFPQKMSQKIKQKIVEQFLKSYELSIQQLNAFKEMQISYFNLEQLKTSSSLVNLLAIKRSKIAINSNLSLQISYKKIKQLMRISQLKKRERKKVQIKEVICFNLTEGKQFIRPLIFINKSDPNIIDNKLKAFFIIFLRNTFPSQENKSEQLYLLELKHHQQILMNYEGCELVTSILEEKFQYSYNLFIQTFDFANKLLEGGNQKNQERLLNIFKKDRKNFIFENINHIIQKCLQTLQFYYDYRKQNEFDNDEYPQYLFENNIEKSFQEKGCASRLLKEVYRFLQLLCENNNQCLKNYIYTQFNEDNKVKYMSINFVEVANGVITELIEMIKQNIEQGKYIDEEQAQNQIRENLFQVINYILDFLIQVCQYPALQNQIYLCKTDFFDIINILSSYCSCIKFNQFHLLSKEIFKMERKIVLLYRGLIQERNAQIITAMKQKIKLENLHFLISQSLPKNFESKEFEQLEVGFKGNIRIEFENIVDILIISKILELDVEEAFSDNIKNGLVKIKQKIREIEVNFRGQLTNIYFCYRPMFNYLSESTKNFIFDKALTYDSRNEKLRDLILSRSIVNQDIMNHQTKDAIMTENSINYLFNTSIFLCFLIIGLQLFFFSVNKSGTALDALQKKIITSFSYMQTLLSFIYLIMWGLNISPIAKQKLKSKNKISIHQNSEMDKKLFGKQHLLEYLKLIRHIYLEQSSSSVPALLLFLVSLASCFYQIRLYSLVLLYIFAKIELLSSILNAIRLTIGKLLVVCLLAIAFSFIFGFLSINNYIKVLYQNQSVDINIAHIDSHCDTIMTCIDSLYTQRIIGQTPSRDGQISHYGRFVSDTIYWAFFDILLTNIIAAIIIDKFAQQRNTKEKIENEKKNKCFICSADKASIERRNQIFEEHIERKHHVWDYFFYLFYLEKLKMNTQYTGIEYWIVKQVKENMTDWLPSEQILQDGFYDKKKHQFQKDTKKKRSGKKL